MPNNKNVTLRVFQSPSKYIQGPTAIRDAPRYMKQLGDKAVLITDDIVHKIAGEALLEAITGVPRKGDSETVSTDAGKTDTAGPVAGTDTSAAGPPPSGAAAPVDGSAAKEEAPTPNKPVFDVLRVQFRGQSSREELERLKGIITEYGAKFIIAMGGGKTIDIGKAAADDLRLECCIMPTTASTDAPCSAVAVLYRPDGDFDRYIFTHRNPSLVIVDTGIVARAPARLLAAGMGDALATNIEAMRSRNSPNFGGGMPALISRAICDKCEEILFKFGKQAYEACKVNAMTPALEAVVEANTLLSGLGFESGGLAAAHAIHDGLTVLHELHHLLHGEKVAFGTICQLVLDCADTAELDRYLAFMLSIDLPVTFEMMGIEDVTEPELRKVAEIACAPGETIWNMDSVITPDVVYQAILGADAVGREYCTRVGFKQISRQVESRPRVSRTGTINLIKDLKDLKKTANGDNIFKQLADMKMSQVNDGTTSR